MGAGKKQVQCLQLVCRDTWGKSRTITCWHICTSFKFCWIVSYLRIRGIFLDLALLSSLVALFTRSSKESSVMMPAELCLENLNVQTDVDSRGHSCPGLRSENWYSHNMVYLFYRYFEIYRIIAIKYEFGLKIQSLAMLIGLQYCLSPFLHICVIVFNIPFERQDVFILRQQSSAWRYSFNHCQTKKEFSLGTFKFF